MIGIIAREILNYKLVEISIRGIGGANFDQKNNMKKRFYKLNNIWYIDLPEFLEQGLGTLANLMMVDGADTFLDFLSNNGTEVRVAFDNQHFSGAKYTLVAEKFGKNQSLLSFLGHAPVQYGRY